MAKIDMLVQEFLDQRRIAVVGISDKRETGCNLGYRNFKQAGYTVFAVNPRIRTYDGRPCYPDLSAIPETPDAVFILASPRGSPSKSCSNAWSRASSLCGGIACWAPSPVSPRG